VAALPFIGLITLDYETFTVNTDPGQTMFVFRAEAGSSHEDSLLSLAQIATGYHLTAVTRAPRRPGKGTAKLVVRPG
jgi:hypothetical protein